MLYLDTNIFIYLADRQSPFYSTSTRFIEYCKTHSRDIVTSIETVQEIVHVMQMKKQTVEGLTVSQKVLVVVDQVLSIDKTTIQIFLDLAADYQKIDSRDVLHLAVCQEHHIDTVITHDKDFKKFKEIKSYTPEEFLKKHS